MGPRSNSRPIVVVDDDDVIRSLICDLLVASGFKVVGCGNGRDGLEAARRLNPSAITLDLHMPAMDGVEVLDHLAADSATASVPVVIVSAYSSDRRLRCRSQVKEIIQKPFDVDDLCKRVRRAANGHSA